MPQKNWQTLHKHRKGWRKVPTKPPEKESMSNGKRIFLVICVIGILVMLYLAVTYNSNPSLEITKATNLFIDVDGDGKVDYVKYIEFISNNPARQAFP